MRAPPHPELRGPATSPYATTDINRQLAPTWPATAARLAALLAAVAVGAALHAASQWARERLPDEALWALAGAISIPVVALAVIAVAFADRARRRLAQFERLATAGAMAASLAHEIKNPMGIILSTTQVLGRSSAIPAADRRLLLEIEDEVRRADDQLNAFLDLARDMPLRREPFDLRDLARTVAALLAAQAHQAKVALSAEVDDRPAPVTADRRRLRQALINLALNAIEACGAAGPGHSVRIRVGPGGAPGEALIAVEDDGPGMTPRQQARAIEPFYTTKPNGTGLGLSIARRIVERHRGAFAIRSRAGAGTAVEIRLPRNASDVSGVHRLRAERREEVRCAS